MDPDPVPAVPDDAPPSLMTDDEVAAKIRCSPRHVRRLADTGRMPRAAKLGSLIRWPRHVIDQWILAGCPDCRSREGDGQ